MDRNVSYIYSLYKMRTFLYFAAKLVTVILFQAESLTDEQLNGKTLYLCIFYKIVASSFFTEEY